MVRESRFWDRHAKGYAKRPVADEESYRKKLEITRSYFRPDMEVLELGCGTGSTALVHAPYVNHIRAVDFSEGMIEIAREKAGAAAIDNVTFECAAVGEIEVPDRRYDAVLCLSLLHLLEDKESAIAEIRRMLKPGGLFVSSTACIADFMAFIRFVVPLGRWLGLLPIVRVFSSKDLIENLVACGFEIEQQWQPGKGKALFVVARRPAGT